MTVTPPSPKESCWGPLSEQGSSGGGGQGGQGPGGQRVRPGVWGALGDRGGHMSAVGKEPSKRQLALLHFRNTITLGVKLEDALPRPTLRAPATVQMLLVLQVGPQAPPGQAPWGQSLVLVHVRPTKQGPSGRTWEWERKLPEHRRRLA